MDMALIIGDLNTTSGCQAYSADGLPGIRDDEVLPDDLRKFYELCGGADLFLGTRYPTHIVSPDNFVPANPIVLVGLTSEQLSDPTYQFSNSWYIIADNGSGEYITIDLNPNRLGYCYDSFWDTHPFDSTIIAYSFKDLLMHLISDHGKQYHRNWNVLGDAFP